MEKIVGPQKYDRTQKGALVGPSGTEFPASPEPLEWFLRTDLNCYYYWSGAAWVAVTPDLSPYLTLNETYNIGESNIGQVKPGTQLSTWGTAFMSSCNAPAHRICLYVTDADLTCTIQGSLYNASLSKIISSDAESTLANGLLTLEFTEPVSLVAGTLYYIAIAVDGDTALLGKTVDIESTQAPILNFVELGAALPATLTPSNSATMLWMRIS